MVVAEGFAVRGHMDQLGVRAVFVEGRLQAAGKTGPVVEQAVEGDVPRDRAVVEEKRDLAPVRETLQVGLARVDGAVGYVVPFHTVHEPHAGRLVGAQDGESDPVGRHDGQAFQIDGGLGQPHAFRRTPEAMFEIADPPTDLGGAVGRIGQGQDHVIVGLGHGRTVPGKPLAALPVGVQDRGIDVGAVDFHPGEQGGPEIEAHAGVIVGDAHDAALRRPGCGRRHCGHSIPP